MNKLFLKVSLVLIALVILALLLRAYLDSRTYQAALFWQASNESNLESVDHSIWQDILDEYLISDDSSGINFVDYEGLKEDGQQDLMDYLNAMISIDPRSYSQPEQFAYWVNLYNALTVNLVVKAYPIESITKVSDNPLTFGPWDDVLATIEGQPVTLNDIEHRILRTIWTDHRIHFAVNCASLGCPNIQAQAFTAQNTERLLSVAAKEYLQHPRGLKITEDGLLLSSIFDWYKEDFGSTEAEVLTLLSSYLAEDKREQIKSLAGRVHYVYDWSLNDAPY